MTNEEIIHEANFGCEFWALGGHPADLATHTITTYPDATRDDIAKVAAVGKALGQILNYREER